MEIEPTRLLISYDKRLSQEQRWIERDSQDICSVGTHVLVPLSSQSSSAAFKTESGFNINNTRLYEVVRCRCQIGMVSCLFECNDDPGLCLAVLEGLRHLCEGEDCQARLQLIIGSGIERGVCECMSHFIDNDEIVGECLLALMSLTATTEIGKLSVGDAISAQWRHKGGQIYPGTISRVRDDDAFDILYEDGDREERVTLDRIQIRNKPGHRTHRKVIEDFQSCRAFDCILQVLSRPSQSLKYVSLCVSILSIIVEHSTEDACMRLFEDHGLVAIVSLLKNTLQMKGNPLLINRILSLLRRMCTACIPAALQMFEIDGHSVVLSCLQANMSNYSIIYGSFNVLSSLIVPILECIPYDNATVATSSGDRGDLLFEYSADPGNHYWQSSGGPPPHSIHVNLKPTSVVFNRWAELSMYVKVNYDSFYPKEINIKVGGLIVKTIEVATRVDGWVTLVTRDEIMNDSNRSDKELVITIEIVSNHKAGSNCRIGSLRFMGKRACSESSAVSRYEETMESRKQLLASHDAVSLALECASIHSASADVKAACKVFLKNFCDKSSEWRELVSACGGDHLLN